jgi:hypothetical protein
MSVTKLLGHMQIASGSSVHRKKLRTVNVAGSASMVGHASCSGTVNEPTN